MGTQKNRTQNISLNQQIRKNLKFYANFFAYWTYDGNHQSDYFFYRMQCRVNNIASTCLEKDINLANFLYQVHRLIKFIEITLAKSQSA